MPLATRLAQTESTLASVQSAELVETAAAAPCADVEGVWSGSAGAAGPCLSYVLRARAVGAVTVRAVCGSDA